MRKAGAADASVPARESAKDPADLAPAPAPVTAPALPSSGRQRKLTEKGKANRKTKK